MKDILVTYRNYLFLLQTRQEYGDKYGDTKELQEMYEKKLEKVLKGEKNDKQKNR